jgi:hypothetical protein
MVLPGQPSFGPPPVPAAPQLLPHHMMELHAAGLAGRKVRRAAGVATVDGWTIAIFGALTMLVGLTDVPSLAIGAALVAIAVIELRGAARLRRLDPRAVRVLGWNQVTLGALLLGYAAWRLVALRRGDGGVSAVLGEAASDPQVREMLAPVAALTRQIMVWTYAAVAAIAVAGPGSLAWYYFSRGRHVREYLARTPEWIVTMQRAGVTV